MKTARLILLLGCLSISVAWTTASVSRSESTPVAGRQQSTDDRSLPRAKVPAPREPNRHARYHLWTVQPALQPPLMDQDQDAPEVNVTAAANQTPPGAADLDPTIDVQITQEIIDKANELGTVQAMYEFVRNECAFQAYYGSRKGSVETLRQRAGNDYDLASLLIALLRASGTPARYADGIVEMPVDRVTSWLAVDSGTAAGSILFSNGMEAVSIIDGGTGEVIAVRARRVWVEAYTRRGFGGPSWVPLDPAFALTQVREGIDIPEEITFDAQGFIDEFWDPTDGSPLPRTETILELFKQEIQDYLDVNYPGMVLDEVMRTHEIIPEHLGLLPASLPYTVRTRDAMYSEIPANRRYQIRFHLHDGATNLIDHTVNLPEIAGKRVTIDYIGATPTDEAIIDANGGIYQTDPATVDLKPVLRFDGVEAATGATGVGMGLVHGSDIHFLAPTNFQGLPQNVVPSIHNVIVCGASQAVALGVEGAAESLLIEPPDDDTEGTLSLLYDTAMDYLAQVRNDNLALARLTHAYLTTDVTSAILENVVNVTYDGFGVPQTFDWVGLRIDADRSIIGVWPVDRYNPPDPEPRDFLIVGGANGSLWENLIFERSYDQASVSTIRILELAVDAGVTVYKRWDTLPLPANTQPTSVRQAIENAIAMGRSVTFPADPMTFGDPGTGQWTGTGWIDMDPGTGAAGYLISGGNNGGATYEVWPPEFIDLQQGDRRVTNVTIEITDPDADSPASDAIFTRDNEQNLTFKYLLHVSYDDGSNATLGPYEKTTRNTTRTFGPNNYTFHVWVARFSWFSFGLSHAERKVSIVGVLIREDDGSDLGKKAPKLLRIAPPPPETKPSVDVMALVIPDEAPDGTPLATGFTWSGGARLSFTEVSMRQTAIEPTDSNPSSTIDDQDVDVTVDLLGGKQQKGYAKFDFSAGGTDEEHKMTVYSVEIDKCPTEFMPQGGSEDNSVMITARARPSDMTGRFVFELFDVSHEDGYCMNAPRNLPFLPWSEDGTLFRDFQFRDQADFTIHGVLWKHTARTIDADLDTATVEVSCFDYGAFGKIRATFEYKNDDGEEELMAMETGGTKDHTNLPLDDDDNNIADGWAHNAGNANDDLDNNPAPGMTVGDGLSRYEEYRGFMVMDVHTRTSPDDKDLFIYDDDGIGLGVFGTLGLTTHLITEDEFNGTNNRQINFRRESHSVVLQHGLWLRDVALRPGLWGIANNPGGVPDSPGNFIDVSVDMAQIAAAMSNPPPAGFQPVGANNRTAEAQVQIIAHELGHAVAIWHHAWQAGCADFRGTHCGQLDCVMRYYFIDMNAANALGPPGDVPAFNAVVIGTTFCDAAPDVCRSDVDVSDQ